MSTPSVRIPQPALPTLLALLLGVAAATPSHATPPQIPVQTEPAGPGQHAGKLILLSLVTPDLTAAKQFYGKLFGWTFRDRQFGDSPYAQALLGNDPVADLFQRPMPSQRRQPAWLAFFSVPDVDAASKLAVQHGAKLLAPPNSLPDVGREAVLADPQGAVFAVLASGGNPQADVLGDPGEWIWSSLMTRDPDADATFYQTLLADQVFPLPAEASARHLLLTSDGYARASINSLPDNRPEAHPYWLSYVRVDDATATAAKVTSLGGRVLVEPRVDRHGSKIAVVADPQGAPFGLMEWPDTEDTDTGRKSAPR